MKILLVGFLSFSFVLNLISTLETFNSQLNNQEDNIYHSESHRQGLLYQQDHLHNINPVPQQNDIINYENNHFQEELYEQQSHSHSTNNVQQQIGIINNEGNQTMQQNRSRLQGNKNQLQQYSQNTNRFQQDNYRINNRMVHPRFRPLFPTRKNNKIQSTLLKTTTIDNLNSNISSNRTLLADSNGIIDKLKSSSLLEILATKTTDHGVQTRRRISFADLYYQQQIRAFFGHQHDKVPSRTYSNIKTGLR